MFLHRFYTYTVESIILHLDNCSLIFWRYDYFYRHVNQCGESEYDAHYIVYTITHLSQSSHRIRKQDVHFFKHLKLSAVKWFTHGYLKELIVSILCLTELNERMFWLIYTFQVSWFVHSTCSSSHMSTECNSNLFFQ